MNNSCVRKVTRGLDCQEVLRVLFALSAASPEENQLTALSQEQDVSQHATFLYGSQE